MKRCIIAVLTLALLIAGAVLAADPPASVGLQTVLKNSPAPSPVDSTFHLIGMQGAGIKQLPYVDPAAPVATHEANYNHLNIPTNQQIGAMTGTTGTPSIVNRFVTETDPRLGAGGGGSGDMLKSTYDPQNKNADAFARANHTGTQSADTLTDGSTNRLYSTAEKALLATALQPYGSQTANSIFAAPNGSAGVPGFRALVAADVPGLPWSKITSGVPAYLLANQNITVTGDATGSGATAISLTLANTAVTPGSYTNPTLTVDAKGRITSAATGVVGAPIDNPTFTTGITTPQVTVNSADNTHVVQPYNTTSCPAASSWPGGFCSLPAAPYWSNGTSWVSLGTGAASGTVTSVGLTVPSFLSVSNSPITSTGNLNVTLNPAFYIPSTTDQTNWNLYATSKQANLNLTSLSGNTAKAATVSGALVAGNQVTTDANGNFISSSYAVGASGGGGSGTVNSGTQYHLPFYPAGGGTVLSDSGVVLASDGSSLTTVQTVNPDSLTLRTGSGSGTYGVTLLGPTSAASTYVLQFPGTAPTAGQIPVFGTPAGSTVPVTWAANSSMVYPGAGIAVSTGSAWGTSLNITAISDSVSTTSSTIAASATAVKAANDLAASKGTGTVTAVSVASANGVTGSSSGGATPALTLTLGNITPSSVVATGLIDGTSPTVLSTTTTLTLGTAYKTNYTFNNYATAATAITYTLPTATAGRTECIKNYTGKTGTLTAQTSGAGQYIDQDGTLSASGGYVISGGALGDGACFVGADSTHWVMYSGKGTWTLH